ncbi:MAG: NB-ARC domain-containing protein [Chloroflexota bacterium]
MVDHLPEPFIHLTLLRQYLPLAERASRYQIQEAINEVISHALELLDDRNPEFGLLLLRRFVSEKPITLREMAKTNRPTAWKKEETRLNQVQKKAITELAEIINGEEQKSRAHFKAEMVHNLGASSYQELVGTLKLEQELVDNLLNNQHIHIYMLTGYGGVGKSSLADRMIRLALEKQLFYHVIRIDVINGVIKPDLLIKKLAYKLFNKPLDPAASIDQLDKQIAQSLTTLPWLIFIDGIEDKLEPILEKIKQFSGPSKFIVTSREKPADQNQIYCKEIPTLSMSDGYILFTQTLNAVHEQPVGNHFGLTHFTPIFDKVGGNPFAIKLVATLTRQMSLPDILEDLKLVDHAQIRALYDRVYKRIWGMLDQKSRQIMISLALFNKKHVTHQMILSMNQLSHVGNGLVPIDNSDLHSCLIQLNNQSLVETSGSILDQNYRYGLHNLTHSYLRTSIIQWPVGFEILDHHGQVTPLPQIQQGLEDWLAQANHLDDGIRPESQILEDLNSITEVIDLALYWPETRLQAVELLQNVWSLLQRHGHFDTLEPQLVKAISFLEKDPEASGIIGRLRNRLGQIWQIKNNHKQALALHHAVRTAAVSSNDRLLEAETCFQLANDYYQQFDDDQALFFAKRGLALFADIPNTQRWIAALENTAGEIYCRKKEFNQALEAFEKANALRIQAFDKFEQARCLMNLGFTWLNLGDLTQAQSFYTQAEEFVGRNVKTAAELSLHVADLQFHLGMPEDALTVLKEISLTAQNSGFLARYWHLSGFLHLRLAQFADAELSLKRALTYWHFLNDQSVKIVESYSLLGEVYLRWRKPAQAIEQYASAIKMGEKLTHTIDFWDDLLAEKAEAEALLASAQTI